jgi:hypothetical protein
LAVAPVVLAAAAVPVVEEPDVVVEAAVEAEVVAPELVVDAAALARLAEYCCATLLIESRSVRIADCSSTPAKVASCVTKVVPSAGLVGS